MLDWVIVGGGVHGVTCGSFLRESGVPHRNLAIVDPRPCLLDVWRESTEAVGVQALRSTHVHHLARDPYSLIRFAASREGRREGKLRGKYGHPDLQLFNKHSDRVIDRLSLEKSHLHDQVIGLDYEEGLWRIAQRKNAPLYAKNVVLALGCDRSLPKWLQGGMESDARVQTGFECSTLRLKGDQKILIVGAGMSGVQLALRYAAAYPGRVTLLSRRAPVKSLFDSDPGWIGPKYRDSFCQLTSHEARRERIRSARRPGSIPPGLLSLFRRFVREKSLFFLQGSLENVIRGEDALRAIVSNADSESPTEHYFHQLVLATGFSSNCPQSKLIRGVAEKQELPLAPCGFPIPQTLSHWGKGLHLSGALAELQVGPVARNIVGARIAGESLSTHVSYSRSA